MGRPPHRGRVLPDKPTLPVLDAKVTPGSVVIGACGFRIKIA